MSEALTSATEPGKTVQARAEEVIRREAPVMLAYFERRTPPSDAPDLLGAAFPIGSPPSARQRMSYRTSAWQLSRGAALWFPRS